MYIYIYIYTYTHMYIHIYIYLTMHTYKKSSDVRRLIFKCGVATMSRLLKIIGLFCKISSPL